MKDLFTNQRSWEWEHQLGRFKASLIHNAYCTCVPPGSRCTRTSALQTTLIMGLWWSYCWGVKVNSGLIIEAVKVNSYRDYITSLSIVPVENTLFCHLHTYDRSWLMQCCLAYMLGPHIYLSLDWEINTHRPWCDSYLLFECIQHA